MRDIAVDALLEPASATAALMRLAALALERRIDSRLRRHALTHAQWRALEQLEPTGELAAGALAAQLGMDTGAATRMLDRLEGKGLCERRRGHADRRIVIVVLTEAGRLLLAHTEAVVTRTLAECFAGVDATEVAVFRRVLRRTLGGDTGVSQSPPSG